MNVQIEIKDDAVKIYINGVIHLCVKQESLLGIQSWIAVDRYMIEIYLIGNTIICEYDSMKKWKKILSLLSKHNLFNSNF